MTSSPSLRSTVIGDVPVLVALRAFSQLNVSDISTIKLLNSRTQEENELRKSKTIRITKFNKESGYQIKP